MRILDKKIENLTDEEIENITMDTLQEHLKETQKNIATIKEAKFNKMFTHVDYIERMRRELLVEKFKGMIPTQESEQARAD